jgi:tetratricopeptide (TPR) repeat protein
MGKRKSRGWLVSHKQIETWLSKAEAQLAEQDLQGAIRTARRVLRTVPADSEAYGQAQYHIGMAYSLLREPGAAYQALSRSVAAAPEDAYAWYNLGLAARMTMRFGRSLQALERAQALATHPELLARCRDEVVLARRIVRKELKLRGRGFTLERLIEQQDLFQEGLEKMEARRWAEAEAVFRRVIEMVDCHPQPHGNLAGSLIMQERYDEAEVELRRALEIDPEYDLARQNLAALPRMRELGPEAFGFAIRDPLAGVKQTVTFVED